MQAGQTEGIVVYQVRATPAAILSAWIKHEMVDNQLATYAMTRIRTPRKLAQGTSATGDRRIARRQSPASAWPEHACAKRENAMMAMSNHDTAEDCPICAKQQGAVVGGPIYQDDLVYAHHVYTTNGPTFLGYVRAETKRHAPSFAELTPEEAQAIGLLVARLSRALKECAGADHVYAFFYGDHVPHLHIHVFARYPGTPQEYWRERVDEWPRSPKGGEAEVASLAERLRVYLTDGAASTSSEGDKS